MSNIKRALIYIGRQRVRSLILFGIFLVTLLLALLGFSVLNASARVGEELRRSVPGYVSVLRDTKHKGPSVTEKTMNEIRVQSGVAEVNANSSQRLVFPELVLLDDTTDTAPLAKQMTTLYSSTDMEKQVWFMDATFTLARGRMLEESDSGNCMISDVVSFNSGLTLGDTVTGYFRNSAETYDETRPFTWTIVGIYRVQDETANMTNEDYAEVPANTLFITHADIQKIDEADPDAKPGQEFSYRKGLQVYPVEQAQLEEVCRDLKEKFPDYLIETEDGAFEQLSGPFRMMQRLLKVLMTVMLVIFSVILILVTALWVKNRVHEMGIYLSVGYGKKDIILQLLTEMLVIALIAVLIAWPVSAAVSGGIGQSLFRAVAQQSGRTAADFNVQVSAAAVFATIGVAVGITMLATMISALQVLALQPKKILSMMS